MDDELVYNLESGYIAENWAFQQNKPSHIISDDSSLKVILLWNSYFGGWNYEFGELGRNAFVTNECEENRCIMTNNRDMEASAHAIVYHYQ